MADAPTTSLQPGQSGPEVKALQEWLISSGYYIPAGATGYYGDQTKAAVTQLQTNLGVDPAGYPGFWGPKTKAAITKISAESQQKKKTKDTPVLGTVAGPTVTPEMNQSLSKYFTSEQLTQLSDQDKIMFAGLSDVFSKQFDMGSTGVFDVNEALRLAQTDPDIATKYGDSLKMGMADFQNAVTDYQVQTGQLSQEQGRQFKEQSKQLSETEAAAGRAYSGFREQAKQKLAESQKGIVESTRRTLQQNLRNLGTTAESKYGTATTPAANINYQNPLTGQPEAISYTPYGGITGSEPLSKKADILKREQQLLNLNPTT